MSDAAALTFRALVDTIMPPRDGRSGAGDLGVDAHVTHAIESLLPGFVAMAGMLLDAYAAEVRPGATFAELSREERDGVLRSMARERTQEMQELVGAMLVFTVGGMYNEWSGYDRDTGRLEPPATWADVGFAGPSPGRPDFRLA